MRVYHIKSLTFQVSLLTNTTKFPFKDKSYLISQNVSNEQFQAKYNPWQQPEMYPFTFRLLHEQVSNVNCEYCIGISTPMKQYSKQVRVIESFTIEHFARCVSA